MTLFRDHPGLRERQTHSRRSIFADRKSQPAEKSRGCIGYSVGAIRSWTGFSLSWSRRPAGHTRGRRRVPDRGPNYFVQQVQLQVVQLHVPVSQQPQQLQSQVSQAAWAAGARAIRAQRKIADMVNLLRCGTRIEQVPAEHPPARSTGRKNLPGRSAQFRQTP